MFQVTIVEHRVINGKPDTYRETILGRNEEHVEAIRRNARACATQGGTQSIKVVRL